MARLNPYSLGMQIQQMFEQGQSFFAQTKVEDWLRQHQLNPADFSIRFIEDMAPVDSAAVQVIRIELTRKDGQPVDPWLLEEINKHT